MSRLDRAMHEARTRFAVDEVPVVCLLGREAEGRRHRLVVLTDHRLLVVGRGTEPLIELSADLTRPVYDAADRTLRLEDPTQTVVIREVEAGPAALLADLVRWRHGAPPPPRRLTLVATG
ncbi:MAG TPA: hypothetical protein VK906_13460 [Egicoccus sp.]|nr:hypothetical protein [Egicoccus sp.]HSK24187.1 hypothetical protein [Egicoccus sp.]